MIIFFGLIGSYKASVLINSYPIYDFKSQTLGFSGVIKCIIDSFLSSFIVCNI